MIYRFRIGCWTLMNKILYMKYFLFVLKFFYLILVYRWGRSWSYQTWFNTCGRKRSTSWGTNQHQGMLLCQKLWQHCRYVKNINGFIRCFHQFVSLIFSTNFSHFEQLKKITNFLLVQNRFLFSVCLLKKKT